MTFLEIYLIGGLATLGLMALMWLVSLALRDSSIVDPFWGTGFVIVNWLYFALAAGGWWAIFSPIIMTVLLMRVSGVTLLEKTLATTKPGYKEYVGSTSAFVPWFPRKEQSR